ncbi:MAG: acyl-CoA thioesterase [Kineosporiaceae bacterium]
MAADEQGTARGVVVPVALRWADMDVYGHVNNTEFLRILEQARVDGLTLVRDPATTGFLVVRHEIEYLRPLAYSRAGVTVRMWSEAVGAADVDLAYEIEAVPAGDAPLARPGPAARARSTLVAYDFSGSRPRRLTGRERDVLQGIAGPPLVMRRR